MVIHSDIDTSMPTLLYQYMYIELMRYISASQYGPVSTTFIAVLAILNCFFFHNFTDFDCLAVAEYLKTNRVKLCRLKYQSMRKQLISHNVITEDEADEIDAIPIRSDKMDKVLTIVQTSLKLKLPTKYKGLLKSMEESSDVNLKAYAKKLGESKSNIYKI